MPEVKPNETREDYVKRCIPVVLEEGTAKDGSQAAAICHTKYDDAHPLSKAARNFKK